MEFVIQYWMEFLFGLVVAGLGWLSKCVLRWKKEQDALKEGVLAMLHDRIFQAHRFFNKEGEITEEELKNVEYLYNSYHALGGNGTGTTLWERIKNLPIKKVD